MTGEDRFAWDGTVGVLWAGRRSYPAQFHASSWPDVVKDHLDDLPPMLHPDNYRHETRQAIVCFENRWCLSTIWGSHNYGSNYNFGHSTRDFIEEPTAVEVGVLMPVEVHHPEQLIELSALGGEDVTMPGYDSPLWGDPLAYVSVPEYHRVAELVMHLPTDLDFTALPKPEWGCAQEFCDFLISSGLDHATWGS